MSFIDGYVKTPLAGIAPWVLLAVVSGPGRFEEAASAALGLTLLTLWMGWRRGVPVHALDVFGAAFFVALAALGLWAPDQVIDWLEVWAGELSNIALALFAVLSLVIGKPFTIAYAKDTTPAEYWATPLFKRVNYAISGVWAAAFTCSAIVGALGNTVVSDQDFWTAWILPIAAILFAIEFTEFYPDYAGARFAQATGEPTDPPESPVRLLDWLPPFIVVTGIAGWVCDALPDAIGIGLIIAGIAGSALSRRGATAKT
jgi:hypothetical protein